MRQASSKHVALLAIAAACLSACSDPTPTDPTATGPVPSGSVSAATDTGGPIGVKECDDYLAKARKCNESAPQEERVMRAKSMDEIEKQWLQQKTTLNDKSQLIVTCKASLDALLKEPCAQ
jgi:hypothetical protein